MYDRILVPTDGSQGSETVTAHAADLAATTGATIHALYVVDESVSDVGLAAEAAESMREAGEAALADVADVAGEYGVDPETELRRGIPGETIVAYADEVAADLVVMGTHGRRGLERYVLGSVTEHVLRASDQPVLAVKIDDADADDDSAASEELSSSGDPAASEDSTVSGDATGGDATAIDDSTGGDAPAVDDEDAAERAARDALAAEGDGLAELRAEPYRESSTWVVPAVTEEGRRVNVHVDARSGDARVAHLD